MQFAIHIWLHWFQACLYLHSLSSRLASSSKSAVAVFNVHILLLPLSNDKYVCLHTPCDKTILQIWCYVCECFPLCSMHSCALRYAWISLDCVPSSVMCFLHLNRLALCGRVSVAALRTNLNHQLGRFEMTVDQIWATCPSNSFAVRPCSEAGMG